MNARDLLEKARRAAVSARMLKESGDADGACNRGYYAMFDAARAALPAVGSSDAELPRTHSGLITAFSLQLVKTGRVPVELGNLARLPASHSRPGAPTALARRATPDPARARP